MSHSGIEPPIIVYEPGDADVFESIEDAELYLEPIDVQKNKCTAYDSKGRLLHLIATSPRITIESAEWVPAHQDELRSILIYFLTSVGISEEQLVKESLEQLVSRSLEYKTK